MFWKILFEIFVLFILFVRFGTFLHFNLFLFYFFRLLKVQELLGHQGLLGLISTPRGLRKVGTLSSFLLIEFLFSMILSLWFSLIASQEIWSNWVCKSKGPWQTSSRGVKLFCILKFTFPIVSCCMNFRSISDSYFRFLIPCNYSGYCWDDKWWSWQESRVHRQHQRHDLCFWVCSWCMFSR